MVYLDQMGNKVFLENNPMRIVSLVPSQTELLHDLGLGDRVVGITKFCIHPNTWFENKKRIGGTKNVDIQKVISLQPDLIIANKEENTKEDIDQLRGIAPVWVSDIGNLQANYDMIKSLGKILACETAAHQLILETKSAIKQVTTLFKTANFAGKSVLYLIWKDPYMSIGKDTFIHHVLTKTLGFINFTANENRYPILSLDKLSTPDYIFLSSEPFPFKEKHIEELREIFPNTALFLVDGEYFSWYGSRLKKSAQYFNALFNQINSSC